MRKVYFASILFPFILSAQITESSDSINAQMLNEIIVEGASQYTSANKTTYLPDRNSKRTARNAADLLAKMAIPQIVVNPSSVSGIIFLKTLYQCSKISTLTLKVLTPIFGFAYVVKKENSEDIIRVRNLYQ